MSHTQTKLTIAAENNSKIDFLRIYYHTKLNETKSGVYSMIPFTHRKLSSSFDNGRDWAHVTRKQNLILLSADRSLLKRAQLKSQIREYSGNRHPKNEL